LPDRKAVGTGVRLLAGSEAIPVAVRLLAVSPRQKWHCVSGGALYDCRYRHARRSHARQEDDRAASGGQRRAESDSATDRAEGWTWRRQAHVEAGGRVDRHLLVSVLAVGYDAVMGLCTIFQHLQEVAKIVLHSQCPPTRGLARLSH